MQIYSIATPTQAPMSKAMEPAVAIEPAAVETLLADAAVLLDEEAVDIDDLPLDVVVARVAAEVMVPTVPERAVTSPVMVGSPEASVVAVASVVATLVAVAVVVTDSSVDPAAAAVDDGVASLPKPGRYEGVYDAVPAYAAHPGTVVLGGARPPPENHVSKN
jgi:hypothetical protein